MTKLPVILLAILLQSCFFIGGSPHARLRKAEALKPFDAVIIPGLPLQHGRWDTLLKSRVLWSYYLYKNGYVKNIIYSGNAVYTPWVESSSMALFAEKLGIDKQHIFVDTLAEHSTENLYYGYDLAKRSGFSTVALASDPFQCAMLHKFARKKKWPVYFLPIVYDSIKHLTSIEITIDTTLTRKAKFISLSEREDYRSRLKGTRGKNIRRH